MLVSPRTVALLTLNVQQKAKNILHRNYSISSYTPEHQVLPIEQCYNLKFLLNLAKVNEMCITPDD